DVALLDGGIPAWRRAGRPVETGPARESAPSDFELRLRPDRRAEVSEVQRALDAKDRPLLDARTPEEGAGQKVSGQKRGGHLPGARLVPEKSLYASDGTYVGADELSRLTGLRAGESKKPVLYCVGGVRSALLAVLLEARLGIRAANYDGSIWEWSADPSRPLVTGDVSAPGAGRARGRAMAENQAKTGAEAVP